MATNRADTLDPALLRPGRLDRKIEFPQPDRRQKRLIFSVLTGKMNLSEEVDIEDCTPRFFFPLRVFLAALTLATSLFYCCVVPLGLFFLVVIRYTDVHARRQT
jgi:SpoVK/Ycf46/Vps4 family AAA+-type ATPase